MNTQVTTYNRSQEKEDRAICDLLATTIDRYLSEAKAKVWHGHPVWFLEDNPTVGYSKQKPGVRLMFWSGAGFDEPRLDVLGEKFKDASIFYTSAEEIDVTLLARWLEKSRIIAWDYNSITKRKGRLERLG